MLLAEVPFTGRILYSSVLSTKWMCMSVFLFSCLWICLKLSRHIKNGNQATQKRSCSLMLASEDDQKYSRAQFLQRDYSCEKAPDPRSVSNMVTYASYVSLPAPDCAGTGGWPSSDHVVLVPVGQSLGLFFTDKQQGKKGCVIGFCYKILCLVL